MHLFTCVLAICIFSVGKSISRWMDTETVVHIYNGIVLSYQKECIWASPNEVDEPRDYYTERIKSERERQILYINTWVWNLERWYWWTHLQSTNGDTDIANRLVEMAEEREDGLNWENSVETYALLWVK